MKKNWVFLVAAVVLCLAALAAGMYLGGRDAETVVESGGLVEETETVSTDILRDGLREIGEMATEEYYYTGVESYDSTKSWGKFDIPFTTTSFIYSYDGVIKAGIDFNEIEVEKDDLKKLVVIRLPAARILSAEIDEESFQLYDEKTSIFNPVSVSDMNDTLIELEKTAREQAVSKGVLERADENAEKQIRSFLSAFDLNGYTIRFEKVTTETTA